VQLTNAVERAMRKGAERAILPRFGMLATHEMEDKGAGELVTSADRESDLNVAESGVRPGSSGAAV
jgi:fructose-1,6-bisphosphatase/inositol monophosphatase family enzyme